MLFCRLLIFFQNQLFQNILFRINRLDPDQAQHIVRSDLVSNCCKDYISSKELKNDLPATIFSLKM